MKTFRKQDIIDGVRHVLEQAGLAPKYIVMDGTLQRCPVQGKPKGKDGAYVVHMDAPPSAWWLNYVTGDTGTWCAKNGDTTPEEREILRQRMERDRAAREKAQAERYARGADKARRIWGQSKVVDPRHPYLVAKGINRVGDILQKGDDLVIPVLSAQGEVMSLQFISPTKDPDTGRDKTFLAGGKIAGGYFPIKEQAEDERPLLICEGYATGASLHHASAEASLPPFAYSVLVAFTAGNLKAVARMARERYPEREIIVCADNDLSTPGNPGVKAATEAAKAIGGRVAVPQISDGGKADFNDIYVTAGAKEVMNRVHAATAPAQEQSNTSSEKNHSFVSFDQDPLPLPQVLPDVPSLPEAICPPSLAPWWQDIAARAQIPLEYPAAASIVILSSLVGRKITIRPKREDDWQVVPNLWGMIVGRPSVLKSHALDTAAAPMKRMAALAKEAYEKEKNAWMVKDDLLDVEVRSLKDQYKKALKDPDANERLRIQHELEELRQKSDAEKVVERRYWTADPTVEKLGELLRDNPQGLLLMRDELAGFLRSFNKQGRENDREYVMECWSGNGSFPQDRIGRGTVAVDGLCLSIIGTIQPGKLNKYVDGALAGEFEDDGLLQRFQVVVWPELPKDWRNEDRRPDAQARDRALEIYTRLDALDDQVGAVYPQYGDLPYLRFDPDAQDLFDQWRTDLEARIRAPEMERTPAFESHLAKYRSLMPSLALVFHLLNCADTGRTGPVTHDSAYRAVEWCAFLEAHARKVYAPELNLDTKTAHALAAKIKEGAVVDGDTLRDVYRNQWAGMTRPDDVRSAARVLEACKWLVLTREGNKEVIRLTPKVKA